MINLKVKGKVYNLNWFNFCLTTDLSLWIFGEQTPHDTLFSRYGIEWKDILISGCSYKDGRVLFRSSPGLDRNEITLQENIDLMSEIKTTLILHCNTTNVTVR